MTINVDKIIREGAYQELTEKLLYMSKAYEQARQANDQNLYSLNKAIDVIKGLLQSPNSRKAAKNFLAEIEH